MLLHVLSRGNDRQRIFLDDGDYRRFLDRLAATALRFGVSCPAYCLMPTHVHLLLEPHDHPLPRLMQQLNSSYCLGFNRRHGRVGHVLQGRYKALLVDTDLYFLRLLRYVLRNPVTAGHVGRAADWPWSSYPATVGVARAPAFLEVERVWRALDAHDPDGARRQLDILLADASDDDIWNDTLAIGSAAFARRLAPALRPHRANPDYVVAARFAARPSLTDLLRDAETDAEVLHAMRRAYHQFAYTLREIGLFVGLPATTVWGRLHRLTTSQGSVHRLTTSQGSDLDSLSPTGSVGDVMGSDVDFEASKSRR